MIQSIDDQGKSNAGTSLDSSASLFSQLKPAYQTQLLHAGNLSHHESLFVSLVKQIDLRYYGRNRPGWIPAATQIEKERFKKGQIAHVISKNSLTGDPVILGYLLSKPTGAFSDRELANFIKLRQRLEPEDVFKQEIEPNLIADIRISEDKIPYSFDVKDKGDRRFRFRRYDEFEDYGSSAGFMLIVVVDKEYRNAGMSAKLLETAGRYYRANGCNYVLGFGRLTGLRERHTNHRDASEHLQDYLLLKREDGLHPDHTIRFHQKAGGNIICGIPYCAHDPESHYHGFMVIYDLRHPRY